MFKINSILIMIFVVIGYLVRNENLLKYELAKRRPDLLDRISWSKPNAGFTQNGITGTFPIQIMSYN